MGQSIKVGIAADHGGFEMKQALIEKLLAEGHEVEDFGADTLDPVSYTHLRAHET